MYLMARGRALPRCTVLNKVSNKSSTNFCRVPCGSKRGMDSEMVGGWQRAAEGTPDGALDPSSLEICMKFKNKGAGRY